MRRVLRCDGVVPQYELGGREAIPDDARELRGWLTSEGATHELDVIAEGETTRGRSGDRRGHGGTLGRGRLHLVAGDPLADAHHTPQRMAQIRERLAAAPPSPAAGGAGVAQPRRPEVLRQGEDR